MPTLLPVPHAIQGVGMGLRYCHYSYILAQRPPVPWFEVITENYLVEGGLVLHQLEQLRAHYPIVLHGVSLSVGSTDPLNYQYLQQLKKLIARFQPAYISDHLCWSSLRGRYMHDLLPLPYTEEAVYLVAERIARIQDYLGQQILIENVSSYLTYNASTMTEWEFINAVVARADCFILLDINNVYVSSYNHGFNAQNFIKNISSARVKQLHLAGYEDFHTHFLDTHGAAISEEVWQLYKIALQNFGCVPTCIERDNKIPEFGELLKEVEKAQAYMNA